MELSSNRCRYSATHLNSSSINQLRLLQKQISHNSLFSNELKCGSKATLWPQVCLIDLPGHCLNCTPPKIALSLPAAEYAVTRTPKILLPKSPFWHRGCYYTPCRSVLDKSRHTRTTQDIVGQLQTRFIWHEQEI